VTASVHTPEAQDALWITLKAHNMINNRLEFLQLSLKPTEHIIKAKTLK